MTVCYKKFISFSLFLQFADMQTLAENDRPAKNHQKGDGFWLEDDPNRIDKVVSLDGDVLLDLGGVAYHREPSNKPQDNIQKDTNNNNNEDKFDSMQGIQFPRNLYFFIYLLLHSLQQLFL